MRKSKRNFRLGVCGALLGAVYFGFPDSAMAWNEPLWVRQLGTETDDYANGVATDSAGNIYLCGRTHGSLGGAWIGYYDAWVAKYDAAGHELWKRQLGTETYDGALGVATDATGNVYLTGWTQGSLGGDNRGLADAWVAKYNDAGHELWKRQLGTETGDYASGLATDTLGNVYLTGYTGDDAWVAKYNPTGDLLWMRQLGTDGYDFAYAVATDATNNVYLTGWTTGSLGGPHRGNDDAWVAKYDDAGHELWTRQLGTEGGEGAYGVATDAEGNVYLTGRTDGSIGGHGDVLDAWVAKYNAAGDVIWTRQLGTKNYDYASGVATDATGNVYLTGWTQGSLGGANRGLADAWLAKYNDAGDVIWKRQLGTKTWDYASGVATDAFGNVYLSGGTEGSLGGANRGSNDVWVAKYSTRR